MTRRLRRVQKVLIVRFSSIGDIVLTTPLIRCLREQRPDVEIHYLSKKAFEHLVAPIPGITRVYLLDRNRRELLRKLRAERYDLIIDLHNNLRSRLFGFLLGVDARRFPKLNLRKWIFVRFKINLLPKVHVVHRYLKTVEPLGVQYDGRGLDFYPDRTALNMPELPGKFIAIAIGAQHATKRLPLEKLLSLCEAIPAPIVVLGGRAEIETGNALEQRFQHVQSVAGKCSLTESAAIAERATVLVSHDTGLMHIGSALRRPVLAVWGNTLPEFGMYPFEAVPGSADFQVPDLKCRPCSKIGFDACPKGHFRCMADQDIQALSRRAMLLFGEEKG